MRLRSRVDTHMRRSKLIWSEFYILIKSNNHSDHIEGEAIIAERNAHANDDGVIDKEERKAIKHAHKRQLANRQRGINGFQPYRTAKWMKEGLVSRIKPKTGSAKRERQWISHTDQN